MTALHLASAALDCAGSIASMPYGAFASSKVDMPLRTQIASLGIALATAVPTFAQPPSKESTGTSAGESYVEGSLPGLLDADKVFRSYRSYADQEVGSWRKANDEVGRIGGWQAYAREAQAPASVDPATGSSSSVGGSSSGHGAHKHP